jgi:hypothetical protein
MFWQSVDPVNDEGSLTHANLHQDAAGSVRMRQAGAFRHFVMLIITK